MSHEGFHDALEACGGLTEFYQSAAAKFKYAEEEKSGTTVPPLDQARALAELVRMTGILYGSQVNEGWWKGAIVTRRVLSELFKQLAQAIEEARKARDT